MAQALKIRRKALPLAVAAALLGLGACAERDEGMTGAQTGATNMTQTAEGLPPGSETQPGSTGTMGASGNIGQEEVASGQSYEFEVQPANPPEAAVEAAESAEVPESWAQTSSSGTGEQVAADQTTAAASPGQEPMNTSAALAAEGDAELAGTELQRERADGMAMAQSGQAGEQPGVFSEAQTGSAYGMERETAEPDTRTMGAGAAGDLSGQDRMATEDLVGADRG